jgi:hypothetical protein
VISSEVNQAGNYALRVWQFDAGSLGDVPLRGLTVALLEKSDENLADNGSASRAVAYLPPGLSPAQRSALLSWARQSTAARLDDAHVKVAPLQMEFGDKQVRFSAGTEMTFAGGVPEACNVGGCVEFLCRGSTGAIAHCGTASFPPLDGSRTPDAFRGPLWRPRSHHPRRVRRAPNGGALKRNQSQDERSGRDPGCG